MKIAYFVLRADSSLYPSLVKREIGFFCEISSSGVSGFGLNPAPTKCGVRVDEVHLRGFQLRALPLDSDST